MRVLAIVGSFLLFLVAMRSGADASIIYIGDQGFTMLDGSGGGSNSSFGGIEVELAFRDGGPRGGGWTIRQDSGTPEVYQTIVGENSTLAENLFFGFEIVDGLNWDGLLVAKGLSNYNLGEWNFFDTEGFLGIRVFSDGDEDLPFYGWIRVSHSAEESVLTVHDWAWNSTPGEPILAGEIPEPAAYAVVFGIGALGFVFLRKRLRRRARVLFR